MAVTAETGPFADVGPFEIGAGRQDDIGKFSFALKPDRLVDHKLQIVAAVGKGTAITR